MDVDDLVQEGVQHMVMRDKSDRTGDTSRESIVTMTRRQPGNPGQPVTQLPEYSGKLRWPAADVKLLQVPRGVQEFVHNPAQCRRRLYMRLGESSRSAWT